MEAAAAQKAHGLYNAVPSASISKYELLLLLNRHLRNDALTIEPSDSLSADKSLVRTRFDFGYTIPDYETMVREMAEWTKSHAEMYPHYPLIG